MSQTILITPAFLTPGRSTRPSPDRLVIHKIAHRVPERIRAGGPTLKPMNILSPDAQREVEDVLVTDGLLTETELEKLKDEASHSHMPIFGLLIKEGHITDEQLTKALAAVSKVPYVNLSKAHIDLKMLTLLPRDVAEQYMAVALGEMQHRLVVAMLDADN